MLLRRKLFGSKNPGCLNDTEEVLWLSVGQACTVNPPLRATLTLIQEKVK